MSVHQLSRTQARRIAVQAQLLQSERPTDLHDLVHHLTLLKIEPTAAIAPTADLVSWSRLGSSYSPAHLVGALEDQTLIELDATIRPCEDMALFRAEMAEWPGRGHLLDWQHSNRGWVAANDGCRREILELLDAEGPLTSRELPDTCDVPWQSTGWTNNQNVTKLLDFMVARGEVAIGGRKGRERLWDLAERVYPDDPVIPVEDAHRILDERRLRALGIARAKAPKTPSEPNDVGDAGEAAVVDGVKGRWRVDPAYLDQPFSGRVALLSPWDRLVHDRQRMIELFEFDYQLEMYKPAAKRRWGYFALPILYDDRLVGKLDATADRKAGELQVKAVHEDVSFTKAMTAAVREEIEELARWLDLEIVENP